MPGFDGTGPMGTGSIGRGRGPCGKGFCRAFGKGFGRGFGFAGRPVFSTPVELSKEEKIKVLKAEKEDIEKELKELEQ